jgi:hypothetical protein
MATFEQLQHRLHQARYRKAILSHLIEYIDENFLPKGGTDPAKALLTDEQMKVPSEVFESVAADTLSAEVQQLDAEINQIQGTELIPSAPRHAAAPQQAPPTEGKKSTKKKPKEAA